MNRQIAVLLVTSSLFAIAWRGDHTGRRTDTRVAYRMDVGGTLLAERSEISEEPEVVIPRGTRWEPKDTPAIDVASVDVIEPIASDEPLPIVIEFVEMLDVAETVEMVLTPEIPLPVDIAAGEYRVVTDGGDVHELVLTPADLDDHGVPTVIDARPSYVLETEGTNWYFVRVVPRFAAEGSRELAGGVAAPTVDEECETATPETLRALASCVGLVHAGLEVAGRTIEGGVTGTRDHIAGVVGRSARRVVANIVESFGHSRTAMSPATDTSRN